jgi:hypothetical protein
MRLNYREKGAIVQASIGLLMALFLPNEPFLRFRTERRLGAPPNAAGFELPVLGVA